MGQGWCTAFCNCFQLNWDNSCQGPPRKAERPVKAWAMGRLSGTADELFQVKGQGAITSAGLVHISFQQAQSSAVCSLQVLPGWCLSSLWRQKQTKEKLKFRSLKENLTCFGTFTCGESVWPVTDGLKLYDLFDSLNLTWIFSSSKEIKVLLAFSLYWNPQCRKKTSQQVSVKTVGTDLEA